MARGSLSATAAAGRVGFGRRGSRTPTIGGLLGHHPRRWLRTQCAAPVRRSLFARRRCCVISRLCTLSLTRAPARRRAGSVKRRASVFDLRPVTSLPLRQMLSPRWWPTSARAARAISGISPRLLALRPCRTMACAAAGRDPEGVKKVLTAPWAARYGTWPTTAPEAMATRAAP